MFFWKRREMLERMGAPQLFAKSIHFKIWNIPVTISHVHIWKFTWYGGWDRIKKGKSPAGWWYGRFKKRPHPDVFNPRRWGGFVLGFEVGCRS